jgi:hypothetical protein
MDIHVEDFKCTADGLFLERVSTTAGDRLLRAPGGGLTPGDVDKHIAIPGAADLQTTITALAQHQIIRQAAMTAGSAELRGVLADPARPEVALTFRVALHVGRRITVAGAGPGGATLVTDVVAVTGPGAITLAQPCAAAVDGAEVHLNAPDQVGLGNYARRARGGLTVDLGDRTITDGVVTLGGRGFASATARFSFEDLGKPVLLAEAGLFTTVIEAVEATDRARLRDAAPRSVTDVAADVWLTDNRQAFADLIAALDTADPRGGEIRFGPGVYDFGRGPVPGPAGAINLRGLRNVTLRGSGSGATILRLLPEQDLSGPDTHLIETFDCAGLRIRDLSIHGSYLTMGKANEQMHGINLNAGTRDVIIERVRFFQTAGDGLRLLGRPENRVRGIAVDHCEFVQNKRTGIGFQRCSESVWVRDCRIDNSAPATDSAIDFEPTGAGGPRDIVIDSTVITHRTGAIAVALSGISGPDPTRRVTFSNNVIDGGTIFSTDVRELIIRHNTIVAGDGADGIPAVAVHVQRGGDTLLITGNVIGDDRGSTRGAILVSEVNSRPVDRSLIVDNICHVAAGAGIVVDSSENVSVAGNLLVAVGAGTQAVLVRAETGAAAGVSVRGNTVAVKGTGSWVTGVHVGARQPVGPVSVTGNMIRGATAGVRFDGVGFTGTPVCALNDVGPEVGAPVAGLERLPEQAVVVAGAASRGGAAASGGAGRVVVGIGTPEGRVAGNLGDVYQRVGDGAGPRFFVKEAATQPTAGWAAK